MSTFINMKTSLQFVCLIFLLSMTNSAGSSHAFTAASLYNTNVHQCTFYKSNSEEI